MFSQVRRWWIAGAVMSAVMVGTLAQAAEEKKAAKAQPEGKPRVQLAILLDTSNSMDGLINQAKSQLWQVVNEFATTKLAGQTPELQVALYEYGNDSLPAAEGYVRQVVPMTDDLDKVSESLFALTTNGGEEYCGKVIQVATQQLDWTSGKRDLRCIFIAGNEPFTQGNVDYGTACKAAAAKGITVSTIHCGDRNEGITGKWEHGAQLADGSYLCINQDHATVAINTPQDKRLAELSGKLNQTYMAYGSDEKRKQFSSRQAAQDANAAKMAASVAASRAGFKASGFYRNAGWDLVDAVTEGKVKLEELKADQLPEAMQKMTADQRKAHLAKLVATRAEIKAQIKDLSGQRDKYVAKERARMAAEAPEEAAAAAEPFADAIRQAVESHPGSSQP